MAEITLPWGAWYGDSMKSFSIPDSWEIDAYNLDSDKAISDSDLAQKLNALPDSLSEKKPKSAVIVVDDLTRPVELHGLLPLIISRLNNAGVPNDKIKVLIGLGSHHGLSKENMQKKLGKFIVENINCINHDTEDVVPIDVVWGKTEVKLNRHYVESDYKIVISGLTAHSFAGFSGGAKMLFPGLADMETLAKTHKSVLMGFMGKLGSMENNKFRATIEDFVQKAGIDFFVGVVINANRSIRNIYCGHYVDAHREAAEEARAYCLTNTNSQLYDVVISSAYPKDTELLQAENGFIPIKSSKEKLLKPGGTYILLTACSEGLGHHGLFGPGGRLYRKPRPIRFLKEYNFILFSENVSQEDFQTVFNEDYNFFNNWDKLIEHLNSFVPANPKVAIFPYGSMQLTG
jgi:lactate racemase